MSFLTVAGLDAFAAVVRQPQRELVAGERVCAGNHSRLAVDRNVTVSLPSVPNTICVPGGASSDLTTVQPFLPAMETLS